jgi:hypothetical protein
LTYNGISQIASNDSVTCIPNKQLKKAINLIELGKVYKEELNANSIKIYKLEGLVNTKDSIIHQYKIKNQYNDSIIVAYKGVVENMNKNLSNAEISFSLQKKKLRKERFKKWGTLFIGVATGYLIFK